MTAEETDEFRRLGRKAAFGIAPSKKTAIYLSE
jgi:hypothetical protein